MKYLTQENRITTLVTVAFTLLFWNLASPKAYGYQLNWSDPATWGGSKPVAGDEVTIAEGTTIILDEHTPDLGGLTITGSLIFADQDLNLTSDWILIHGTLQVGTEEVPYTHKAIITLTGNDTEEDIMGMGTRGIMVMGGTLEMHGNPPTKVWTKINAHAEAGATSLTLMEPVDWQTGDEIAIAPTDYYEAGNGISISQKITLNSVSGTDLGLSEGLNAFRWGLLQYATNSGMSLDPVDLVTPSLPDTGAFHTPVILDQRASVGNLTRNILIQAPNDALWNNEHFGVHIMIMGDGASARLDGVEIQRGGQAGRMRRYPAHFHMLSYSGTETLADAEGQFIRNSVINSSVNRGIVIHGTNGLQIQNNIVFDVRGHGIFTEDAVERRNTIDGNLVLHVRNQPFQYALKEHETGERGASCFWLSNPDNIVTNNTAADCGTNGFWMAYPFQPWGESINVLHEDGLLLNPSRLKFGVFDNNTTHSNRSEGIMLDRSEINNLGTTLELQYQSTTNGRPIDDSGQTLLRFTLSNYKTWKNGSNGIWDRAAWPDNFSVVSADNVGRFFAGSGADGIIERSLVVGTSLNHMMNGTGRRTYVDVLGNTEAPVAFATYHSAFDIKNNIVISFPMVPDKRSGTFATEDYYIRPVDKGQVRNVGNTLIDSHPGVKLPAPFNYFALAGALWDPHHNWGGDIENGYLVYDTPFFTHGQTPYQPDPGPEMGGVTVEGPFYGFNHFILNLANLPWEDLMAISVGRFNSNFEQVGSWSLDGIGNKEELLAHMRHFAAHPSGYYELSFPDIEVVSDVAFSVENMLTKEDTLVLAVEYSGGYEVGQVYASSYSDFLNPGHAEWPTNFNLKHVYEPVNSREEVITSAGKEVFWHDKENDLVWMKIVGGIGQPWNDQDYKETDDERLYRKFNVRIYGTELPVSNENDDSIPGTFTLYQNYPNPFNPSTSIQFDIPESSQIRLEVFDVTGRLVSTLFDGVKNAGTYTLQWDAKNNASGIYFLKLSSAGFVSTQKVTLLK